MLPTEVQDLVVRLAQSFAHHSLPVDVKPGEEGLVQGPPAAGAGLSVQLTGVVQKFERLGDDRGTGRELAIGSVGLLAQAFALLRDGSQPVPDLPGHQLTVGGQVEQVVLPGLEAAQLGCDLGSDEVGAVLLISDGRLKELPDALREALGQHDALVVTGDHLVELLHPDVGLSARSIGSLRAEEVLVGRAVTVDADLEDESRGDAAVGTRPTEQAPLEVVVVLADPLGSNVVAVHDGLDLVERELGDERRVAARVLDAVVDDPTEVVRVTQQGRYLGR